MVENMRLMLRSLDSSRPYFLGRRFNGFLSGGCGYLMTANTIRLLVEQGFNNERCRQVADKLSGDQDDLILSVCRDKLDAHSVTPETPTDGSVSFRSTWRMTIIPTRRYTLSTFPSKFT